MASISSTSYALKKDYNRLTLVVNQEKPCDLTITDLTFKNASGGSTLYTDQNIIYTFTVKNLSSNPSPETMFPWEDWKSQAEAFR